MIGRHRRPVRRIAIQPRDWILFIMLIFLIGIVASRWGDYTACEFPENVWLVAGFSSVLLFRILQFSAQWFWNGSYDSWSTENMPKYIVWFQIWLLFPFMLFWAVLGCVWYRIDHQCVPDSIGGWGFILAIALLLIFSLQYFKQLFLCVRYQIDLARSQDANPSPSSWKYLPSTLYRLHHVALDQMRMTERVLMGGGGDNGRIMVLQPVVIQPQQQTPPRRPDAGLSEAQIQEIPKRELLPNERVSELCSICLIEFPYLPTQSTITAADPSVDSNQMKSENAPEISRQGAHPSRVYSSEPIFIHQLPCRHIFHASCLDAWLKEKRLCPNCRVRIGPPIEEDPPQQQQSQLSVHPYQPQAQQPPQQRLQIAIDWMRQQQPQQSQQQQQMQPLPQPPQQPHQLNPYVYPPSSSVAYQSHPTQSQYSSVPQLQPQPVLRPSQPEPEVVAFHISNPATPLSPAVDVAPAASYPPPS